MPIPVVAHLMDEYSPLSQTFIYQYLSKMSATHPVVIAQNIVNLDLFPLKDVFFVKQPSTIRWLRARLFFRFAADPYPLTEKYVSMITRCGAKVLHAHFGHVGYQALALKRRLNLPLVVTFYGFDMSSLPTRKSWRKAYHLLFREADRFLVEGPTMAKKLENLGYIRRGKGSSRTIEILNLDKLKNLKKNSACIAFFKIYFYICS